MKCVKCGKNRDLRFGWCFPCFDKAQKARTAKKPAKKATVKKAKK